MSLTAWMLLLCGAGVLAMAALALWFEAVLRRDHIEESAGLRDACLPSGVEVLPGPGHKRVLNVCPGCNQITVEDLGLMTVPRAATIHLLECGVPMKACAGCAAALRREIASNMPLRANPVRRL